MPTNLASPPEPNLTYITEIGRKAVKYFAIGLVVLIVGRMLLTGLVTLWKIINPEPPPPPTVGFGKLPAIDFPLSKEKSRPKTYRLETANGKLPSFSDRAKVFFMPASAPSLLADQRAKEIAATYDFVFQPDILDERTYRWVRSSPLETSLTMDIQNLNFKLNTDFLTRPELIVNTLPPDKTSAIRTVKSFLDDADLLPDDMATASATTTYLKSLGSQLKTAVSVSDADFIKVDLNRGAIDDEFFIYTDEGETGIVSAILTGVLESSQSIVQLQYYYHPADYEQIETYPLKDVRLAWQELQAGEGFVVKAGDSDEAVIREVALAYFDSYDEQPYLQPIYVFAGDDGFLAYVSAVSSTYVLD